jgi:hypothetical protein
MFENKNTYYLILIFVTMEKYETQIALKNPLEQQTKCF